MKETAYTKPALQRTCYYSFMERAGFVLAGGRSTRMGRDKALLRVGGQTLLENAIRAVAAATGYGAILGPPERYAALGFPVFEDLYPSLGPLGGIETALALGLADWNLIVACDMPGISAGQLRALLAQVPVEWPSATCVAALGPSGPEPLCAVYHTSCLPVVRTALDRRALKMRDLLGELRTVTVSGFALESLANVNTPTDWADWGGGQQQA